MTCTTCWSRAKATPPWPHGEICYAPFRRPTMGRALSHRRDRQLAGEPKGPDLTVRDRSSRLDRKSAAGLDHEGTGEEQSRHRHGQAGLAAARNALPWVLWLPLLLGRHRTLGQWPHPEHDADEWHLRRAPRRRESGAIEPRQRWI